MKNSLFGLLAVAGLAAAQGATSAISLPQCALSCFQYAVAQSGCQMNDAKCQCGKGAAKIAQVMQPCLCQSSCQSSEFEQASTWSDMSCQNAGGSPFSVDSGSCGSSSGSGSGGSVMVGGAPPITSVPSTMATGTILLTASSPAAHSQADGTPLFFSGTAQITPAGSPAQPDGNLATATGSPSSNPSSIAGSGSGFHSHSNSSSIAHGNGTRAGHDAQTTTAPGSASRVAGGMTLVGALFVGLMVL